MRLGLADHVRFCIAGNHVILMDVSTGRYLALPGEQEQAFIGLARGDAAADAELPSLKPLVARGLLVPSERRPLPTPPLCPTDEAEDLVHALPGSTSIALMSLALWAEASFAIRRRRLTVPMIRDRLARWRSRLGGPHTQSTADPASYLAIFAAFERIATFRHSADRCLVRSLAFLAVCTARGLAPSLVFGVRVNPFAAHCWVQDGRLIANDEFERVRTFTPILVL